MLTELRVAQLGVIEDVTVELGPGMTVLTGETGAGKTLIVDAIALLRGVRGDPAVVRPGATEAVVEGRFVGASGDQELVLRRTIPATGRGRASLRWTHGQRLAPRRGGQQLVDLHGPHAHQSLLHPAAQRRALGRHGRAKYRGGGGPRRAVRELMAKQAELGGDPHTQAGSWTSSASSWASSTPPPWSPPPRTTTCEARRDGCRMRPASPGGGNGSDCLATDDGIIDQPGIPGRHP